MTSAEHHNAARDLLSREYERMGLPAEAQIVDCLREAFAAGWEALRRVHEGPSAAGYPEDENEAWQLYEPDAIAAFRAASDGTTGMGNDMRS